MRTPALVIGALLAGCSARPGPITVDIPPGRYAEAFDATRELLVSRHLDLDRVDARHGVITAAPSKSAGLLTPWDGEQTTIDQEVADTLNNERRRVRVTFERRSAEREPIDAPAAISTEPIDLRVLDEPLVARFDVVTYRRSRPGLRVETDSIRRSRRWLDQDLLDRDMQPAYEVAVGADDLLGARLARLLSSRLATASPADPAGEPR